MSTTSRKPRRRAAAKAWALAAALVAGSAGAASEDVHITFSGRYVPLSCFVSQTSITVVLPTISTQSLAAPGDVAGATRFDIPIECDGTPGAVRAYFEAGPTVDASGRLNLESVAPSATPQGVQIELLNADGSVIRVGDKASIVPVAVPAGNTAFSLLYFARYYATGSATPGIVKTFATYTLDIP